MSIAEYKYTDRDVRENDSAFGLVEQYLVAYEGSFEFLIDCRMRILNGYELTVGMVRGVLNCMRVDPRVPESMLPTPLGPEDGAEVIPMQPRRYKPKPVEHIVQESCPLMGTEHGIHWFPLKNRSGQQHCIGWHALTREITRTKARFHAPYLRGQQSNLIHRSTHEGTITWFPPFHQYGPAKVTFWQVDTVCPIQSLRNPDLLDAEGVKAAEAYTTPTASKKYKKVTLCSRCFPGSEGDPL